VGVVHATKSLQQVVLTELFDQLCLSMVGTTLATTSLVIIVGAVTGRCKKRVELLTMVLFVHLRGIILECIFMLATYV
jgi:hypothetical protein